MTREELFGIFDILKPSVSDVRLYLDRICGVSPLELDRWDNGELVDIFDVLKPSVSDIHLYLKRICGVSPLELVWWENGRLVTSHKIKDVRDICGVMLSNGKSYLYLRSLTFADFKKFAGKNETPGKLVSRFIAENFPEDSHLLTEEDAKQIDCDIPRLKNAFSILRYHGRTDLPKIGHPGYLVGDDLRYVKSYNSITNIEYFLEMYGDILVVGDYMS